uniref:Protein kinase domain-containing protein n=1 Tax=Rhizophagus irregularis (strain DAOM 181602 / DAOM 197198 / MUCL 43194) TaxID=747089 RepID=U9USR4_RHIID
MDVDEEQNNDYDNGEIESTQPKKTGSASSSNKGKKRANEELNFALHICRGIAYLNALGINNVRVTFLSKREFFHLFSLPCFECENIMVTESNLAKLANFGTSREKHDATTTIGSQPERFWNELAFSKNPYENFEIDKISDHVIAGGREIFPTHGTIERNIWLLDALLCLNDNDELTEDNRLKVWSQVTYGKNEECGVQEESGT